MVECENVTVTGRNVITRLDHLWEISDATWIAVTVSELDPLPENLGTSRIHVMGFTSVWNPITNQYLKSHMFRTLAMLRPVNGPNSKMRFRKKRVTDERTDVSIRRFHKCSVLTLLRNTKNYCYFYVYIIRVSVVKLKSYLYDIASSK